MKDTDPSSGPTWKCHYGIDAQDALRGLAAKSLNCVVTSPPFWLHRSYGGEEQAWADGWRGHLGLEPHPDKYVAHIAEVMQEVKRVLRTDGVVWLHLGDTRMSNRGAVPTEGRGREGARAARDDGYAESVVVDRPVPSSVGLRFKALVGIPWRVAFALQNDGWIIRNEVIWSRPDHMPSPARDRLHTGHETVFLLSRSPRYWFNREAAIENGLSVRLRRTVWEYGTGRSRGRHHAVMPTAIIEPMILMGCPPGGTVLDPFAGTASTGEAALRLGRNFVGVELNAAFEAEALVRLQGVEPGRS